MKKLIFASALFILCSCKKDPTPIKGKNPNNHVEATVTFSSGKTLMLNETGDNVSLLRYTFDSLYKITVINSMDQQLIVIRPDTKPDDCGYHTDWGANNDSLYLCSSTHVPGDTLVFTAASGTHREGYFTFSCMYTWITTDTIKVTGSFKGEFDQL